MGLGQFLGGVPQGSSAPLYCPNILEVKVEGGGPLHPFLVISKKYPKLHLDIHNGRLCTYEVVKLITSTKDWVVQFPLMVPNA